MQKTYITKMPDHAGAFLEASKIISGAGANIIRVSYNKAVDAHMLFIDVAGDETQLDAITSRLESVGYISDHTSPAKVILLEFELRDVPGSVLPILELINTYDFNISYIGSQGDGTDYQHFKMGLFIDNPDDIKDFLEAAVTLCSVKIVHYDTSKKMLDNTVFYLAFAHEVASKLHLDRASTDALIADSNLIMQMLEEREESPYKTFGYIGSFADMLDTYKGARFDARVTSELLPYGFTLHSIEPSCGSNTFILEKEGQLLFIDCGFACYKDEMDRVIGTLIPRFTEMKRSIVVTHPDIDHCGLLSMFETVYVSAASFENFVLESRGEPNFREQKSEHAPYCRISKVLSRYTPPEIRTLSIIDGDTAKVSPSPIKRLGNIDFGGLTFDVYEGNGGHACGELVIVSEDMKLVFSGDIVVNISEFSEVQAEFNKLAPYLMTSVNMDSQQASEERAYLLTRFSRERYTYCCGHGAIMRPASVRESSEKL
jgi:glyoxylase-like metal-dependent hydrolase (beta-lactamase superfamily II)/ACT domain-containing protein